MTRILVPSGALGLGWDAQALERGIAARPDLIAIDGGSTDSGPSYLGRGVSKYARSSTKAEWAVLIDAARRAGCPLIVGTAGTCGASDAVDWLVIVMLGAMIPVGGALEASGATAVIANGLVDISAGLPAWVILTLVLVWAYGL